MIQNEMAVPKMDSFSVERRATRRRRALKGARLIFNCGQSVADAVVRDMNETGVRLRLGDTVGVPRQCMLTIVGSDRIQSCEVVWRTQIELGMKFV